MTINRRDFLCRAAAGTAAVSATAVLAPAPAEARGNLPIPEQAVGLLYDSTLCIGCKACMSACKEANQLGLEDNVGEKLWDTPLELSGKTYTVIKIYQHGTMAEKDKAENGFAHLKRQCLHCADPSCVSACPVNAMTKDGPLGIVEYDKDACIGCRYCVAACPFGVPQFQYDTPTPEIAKCQLCKHLLAEGRIPACAQSCPTGATLFGSYPALSAEIDRRKAMAPGAAATFPRRTVDSGDVHEKAAPQYVEHVYGQSEVGGTQVRYLSGVPFDKLGLPTGLPERSYSSVSETLQHTLYGYLAAPAVVLGGLVVAALRGARDHHDEE
ncbi:hydrogenase 2 operon protein HybA [Magnetospirillum sp. UT-4]|uniref:hydrogenase 2 operon protein HybA n=1 Tax=Magnetospirillum sp. UT-4 TaxID=2681467 RepID=UPI0013801B31|nr:hydrogenase 2 operon protein HybA [Magnetospirillum sp. UT-4]CAA7614318.1 hydrogenase 2 4Fe-4S ferredoxin-type component [Magnetospirillum sp. UT-4]